MPPQASVASPIRRNAVANPTSATHASAKASTQGQGRQAGERDDRNDAEETEDGLAEIHVDLAGRQAVADPSLGQQVSGPIRIRLQLATKAANRHPHV